jgi:hypothetical protein
MTNLIKILLVVAVAAFSTSASAFAYKSVGVNKAGHNHVVVIKKIKVSDFGKKSFNCGILCSGKKVKFHKTPKLKVSKRKIKKLKRFVVAGDNHFDYDGPKCDKPERPHKDVPEPAMAGLLAIGLIGIAARRKLRI